MAATIPNGTLIAERYRITDVIARGGMGVIYHAHDAVLDRPVAVKTVRRHDATTLARLRREARILGGLNHPNIVRLYDSVEHDGQQALVSELVGGAPLSQHTGPVDAAQVAGIVGQVASALDAAHSQQVTHRDLTPANILVDDDHVHLLDFGLARHVDDATLTTGGVVTGTAAYLAPEQLNSDRAGTPADIYALGLVAIELHAGQPAFDGTLAETVAARLAGPPAIPTSVPDGWRDLIASMVALNPADRPTASQVVEATRLLAAGRPVVAPPAPPATRPMRRPRRRHPRWWTGAAAAVAATVAVLICLDAPPQPVADADPPTTAAPDDDSTPTTTAPAPTSTRSTRAGANDRAAAPPETTPAAPAPAGETTASTATTTATAPTTAATTTTRADDSGPVRDIVRSLGRLVDPVTPG